MAIKGDKTNENFLETSKTTSAATEIKYKVFPGTSIALANT